MRATDAGLAVGLLGNVVLYGGNSEVDAGTPKQACVLAVLAWNAGTAVGSDTLIDRVWGDDPPQTARKTLAGYITRLRRLLVGTGAIITCRNGAYTLHAPRERVDVYQSQRLAARARRESGTDLAAATRARREALGLWRGAPMTGVEGHWAARIRAGLEQDLQDLWIDLFDGELAAGQHRRILPQLAEWVHRAPLAETLVGQYMLALYRSERATEALSCFRRTRARLHRDHGADPGNQLTELHRRILRDDRSLLNAPQATPTTAAAPVPRQLPAGPHAFTARSTEVATLDSLSEVDGRLPIVAIVGIGGIGKTALALHCAHRMAAGFPDGQLYVDMHGYSPGEMTAPGNALAGFLRALGMAGDDIPADTDERAAAYRSLLAGKRMLIMCDNVRDTAQLRPLLPAGPGCQLIVTSRSDLRTLTASHDVRVIGLDILSIQESERLLDRVRGGKPGDNIELARLCGGLPLALRLAASQLTAHSWMTSTELTQLLGQDTRLSTLSDSDDPYAGLRSTFDSSYRALDADSQRLFRMFGLHPSAEPDTAVLAAMAASSVGQTSAVLRRLASAHLVHRNSGQHWGTHDLLREYAAERAAEDDTGAARLQARIHCYDWYLASTRAAVAVMNGTDPDPQASESAAEFATRAQALQWLDDQRDCLVATIGQAIAQDAPRHGLDLIKALWRYLWFGEHHSQWRSVLDIGLPAARRLGDLGTEADLLRQTGHVHTALGSHTVAVEFYQQALERDIAGGNRLGEAISLSCVAESRLTGGEYAAAYDSSRQAAATFAELGDRNRQAQAVDDMGHAAQIQGELELAKEHFSHALRLYQDNDLVINTTATMIHLGRANTLTGDFTAAEELLEHAITRTREECHVLNEAFAHSVLGTLRTRQGHHKAALAAHRQAQDLVQDIKHPGLRMEIFNNAGFSFTAASRPAAAVEFHMEALDLSKHTGERYEEARARHGLSDALRAFGKDDDAADHWQDAMTLYRRLGTAEAALDG